MQLEAKGALENSNFCFIIFMTYIIICEYISLEKIHFKAFKYLAYYNIKFSFKNLKNLRHSKYFIVKFRYVSL